MHTCIQMLTNLHNSILSCSHALMLERLNTCMTVCLYAGVLAWMYTCTLVGPNPGWNLMHTCMLLEYSTGQKKTHSSISQISQLRNIGSLENLKLKLTTVKWTANKNLVKIRAYMRAHEAKRCVSVYAQCQNVRTRIYASCTHVLLWNLTKIVLIVHYYVTT